MSKLDQALAFYLGLEAEVTRIENIRENCGSLCPKHYDDLARYYQSLRDHERLRLFYRFNWARRVEPMLEILHALPERETRWRLLDAGCGTGTESIFWSTVREDVEVTGVDIHRGRLEVARARQAAYEDRLGRGLNLRFLDVDVFRALDAGPYDLVWAMESISHIDPAEAFLAKVLERLNAGGYRTSGGHLVISDSHLLNPAMAWRVWRLRASGVAERTHRTLDSGTALSYAQERLFTVGQLSRVLRSVGFQSVQSHLSVFFPPALARFPSLFRACVRLEAFLSAVVLVRNLGAIYTIVATK
jgi:SAM-dependent methyltransferase